MTDLQRKTSESVLVKINTSGVCHEVSEDTLVVSGASGHLLQLVREAPIIDGVKAIRVDRPADSFGAILSLYQTGELHLPARICPAAFKRELTFWEVDPLQHLAPCCLFVYQSFFEDQKTLNEFKTYSDSAKSEQTTTISPVSMTSSSRVARFRARVWSVVDNREVSLPARVYLTVLFTMVLASIIMTAFDTVASFKRPLKKCELLEYMDSAGPGKYQQLIEKLRSDGCPVDASYFYEDDGDDSVDDYWEFEDTEQDQENMTSSNDAFSDSKRDGKDSGNGNKTQTLDLQQLRARRKIFKLFDFIAAVYFTLDFFIRITTCPSPLRYFFSLLNIVDFLALAAYYFHVCVNIFHKEQKYIVNWIDMLDLLQVLRVLRIFRVVKNIRASQVFIFSIRKNAKDLLVLVLFLLIGISSFSSLIYICENNGAIDSVPLAWWWAVVTMTTVGYGDVVPTTTVGRVLGALCAVSGVALISLTLPIFVNNFLSLYKFACVNQALLEDRMNKGNLKTFFRKITNAVKPTKLKSPQDSKRDLASHEMSISS